MEQKQEEEEEKKNDEDEEEDDDNFFKGCVRPLYLSKTFTSKFSLSSKFLFDAHTLETVFSPQFCTELRTIYIYKALFLT